MTRVRGAADEARKPRPSIRRSIEDVGKFVGRLGVVGSLLFVGVQVRQNSIATQAATNAAVADGFREFNMMMASSPDLARAFVEYAAAARALTQVTRGVSGGRLGRRSAQRETVTCGGEARSRQSRSSSAGSAAPSATM
jgi:hypothetical protein